MSICIIKNKTNIIEITNSNIDLVYYIHDNNPDIIFKYLGKSNILARLNIIAYKTYKWNDIRLYDNIVFLYEKLNTKDITIKNIYIAYITYSSNFCSKYLEIDNNIEEHIKNIIYEIKGYENVNKTYIYNFMKNFNIIYKSHFTKKAI